MEKIVRELIEELELELRCIIKTYLVKKYPSKWLQILQESMTKEEIRNYEKDKFRTENDLINYANIGTLKTFICKEWQDFRGMLNIEKGEFDKTLDAILPVRNALFHHRKVPNRELKRAEVFLEDILDLLNANWKEQLAQKRINERRKIQNRILLGALIVFFAVSVSSALLILYKKTKKIPVIDVLPFKNKTNDTQLNIFGDTLSETIKNKLAHCSQLFIIDTHNRENIEDNFIVKNAYAAEEKEKNILKKFGVNFLVKGSFAKFGDKFTITAQIVDLKNNKIINSAEYEGLWSDSGMLDAQNKLAYRIIDALNISILPNQKKEIDNIPLPNPIAYEYFSKTWDLYLQGSYQEVLELCKKTLEVDPKFMDAYRRMGNTYEMIGDIEEALRQYKKWEKIAYDNKDALSLTWAFVNIGKIYKFKDDHDKELYYYQKALEISLKSKNDINIARAYNALGNWYYHKEIYKEALNNFFKAVFINHTKDYIYNHKYNLAANYLAIGKVYSKTQDAKKAIEYYKKSLSLYEELEGKVGIAETCCLLAELYFQDKQYKEAIDYYKRALLFNNELKNIEKSEEIEERIREISNL